MRGLRLHLTVHSLRAELLNFCYPYLLVLPTNPNFVRSSCLRLCLGNRLHSFGYLLDARLRL